MENAHNIIEEDVEKVVKGMDTAPLQGARILLLGANGIIGSYFAHFFEFLNRTQNAGIRTDLITLSPVTKDSRIGDLVGKEGFTVIQKDLAAPTRYEATYDYIVHAAGYSAPANFLADPLRAMDVNYIGLRSVLESCVANGSKPRVLYVSSSETYGAPTAENVPTPENYPGNAAVTNGRACYIESKRLSEVLALQYERLHGIPVKIARVCLAYGPGITFDDKRVLGQFMGKAYREKKIQMVDEGRDLRSFCYLSDILRQLLSISFFAKDTIYNVGSEEEEVSIKGLADIVGEAFGVPVIPGPGKTGAVADAPGRARLNMSKLEQEFGFKPQVPLKEGVKRTIQWNLARLSTE